MRTIEKSFECLNCPIWDIRAKDNIIENVVENLSKSLNTKENILLDVGREHVKKITTKSYSLKYIVFDCSSYFISRFRFKLYYVHIVKIR